MNQYMSNAEYSAARPVSFQEAATTKELTLVDTLRTMAKIHFDGNIKPHAWFKHIRFSNGKPDSVAMDLLSEIVYWYRPETKKKEQTGEVVAYRKRFKADKLQRSIGSFSDQFGYTKRQVSEALGRLEALGLIDREYRTINTAVGKLPNVLYIGINAVAIQQISQCDLDLEENTENDEDYNDYLVPVITNDEITLSPKKSPLFDDQTSMRDVSRSMCNGHTPMCDGTTPNAVGTPFYVRPSHSERDTSHTDCSTYTETTTEITTAAASNDITEKDNASFAAAAAKTNKNIFPKKTFMPMAEAESLIGDILTPLQRDYLQKRVTQLELSDEAITILFKQLEAGLLDCEHCFTKSGRDFYFKLNAMLKSVKEGTWTPPANLQLQENKEKEIQAKQKQREVHTLWLELNNTVNHVLSLKRNLAAVNKTAPYYQALVQQHDEVASHVKAVQTQILAHCPDTNFNQIPKEAEEKFYA